MSQRQTRSSARAVEAAPNPPPRRRAARAPAQRQTTRITNEAIKKTDERVKTVLDQTTSNKQIEQDQNLKSNPDVKDQLKSINDKFAANTFIDRSNFDLNLKITEIKKEIKNYFSYLKL